MNEELPLDHGEEVLDDTATEDELDEEMTTIFWGWNGDEEWSEDCAVV